MKKTFALETYVTNGVDLERMMEQHEARMDILCDLVGFEGYGQSAIDKLTLVRLGMWLEFRLDVFNSVQTEFTFNLKSSPKKL